MHNVKDRLGVFSIREKNLWFGRVLVFGVLMLASMVNSALTLVMYRMGA